MEVKSSLNEQDKEIKEKDNVLFKQVFANIPPILLNINNGMVAGYSAILLPQLQNEDSILHPTKSQESWIASLAPLLMALGCIFSGLSMDRFGRKPTLIMVSVIAAIGWMLIYFSPNINTLLIGRIITGLGVGYSGVCLSSFIGEISNPKYRGFFLNCIVLGASIGILIVHFLGIVFYWRTVALIITILPLISITMMSFIPESHIWHINKNRLERAKSCYIWFRGNNAESKAELDKLLYNKMKQPVISETFFTLLEKCTSQRFIKPFFILILVFITSQTTGSNAVIFYSVQIMQSTVEGTDKYTSTLAVDALRVLISGIACLLIKKYKVRHLSMLSGLGTTLSLLSLSLFIHLMSVYPQNKILGIIPLFCFMSYIIFISIGIIPLSWILLGEILPPEMKGIGGGISSTMNFLMFFFVVKTNPDLMEHFGSSGTFATYAVCTMIRTVLLHLFLPETRGKTLEEIQEYFVSRPNNNG